MPTTEGRHSDFEQVHATQHLAITDTRLEAIRETTDADEIKTTLKNTILHGWPEEKPHVPPQVHGYLSFRDELSVTADIQDYISTCSTCRTFEAANPKETLMSHDVPDRPWAKIGTDLFAKDGKDYLIS